MDHETQFAAGVNASVGLAAVNLAHWQSALGLVLGRYAAAGLVPTDGRAVEAYRALEAGRWLEAVLWLHDGPTVDQYAALADPLGSLLAAIVLRVAGPLVAGLAGRAGPFWRAYALAYWQAIQRRPARDPLVWVIETLLRAGGGRADLAAVEAVLGERIDARRVDELVTLHVRAWEVEAMERLLVHPPHERAGLDF